MVIKILKIFEKKKLFPFENQRGLFLEILTYFPLLISLFIVFYLSIIAARIAHVYHPDGAFEFRNAKNLVVYGILEPGPIINQILNAFMMFIFGVRYRVILYVQVIFNVAYTFAMFLLIKIYTRNKVIAGFVPLFFIIFLEHFYVGPIDGKHYPLFMTLLLFSIYFLFKADEEVVLIRKRLYFFFSSVLLSLTFMTHIIVSPSLLIPPIYFLYKLYLKVRNEEQKIHVFIEMIKNKDELFINGVIYASTLILLLTPFLLWRIFTAGLDRFYEYPVSWGVHKYGALINTQFWGHPGAYEGVKYWELQYRILIYNILFPELLVFILLGLISLKNRGKTWLLGFWLFVMLIPYLADRVPPAIVYQFIFIPIILILVSIGLERFTTHFRKAKRYEIILLTYVLLIFLILSSLSLHEQIYQETERIQLAFTQDLLGLDLPENTRMIFRIYSPETILTHITVLMITKDIAEPDAVNILNWTSDKIVAETMARYNITHYMVYTDRVWETDYYNVWTEPFYNFTTRHREGLNQNYLFFNIFRGNSVYVYEINTTVQSLLLGGL